MGTLARRAGLSRSTLLYYDRIGLLPASGRSASGYRLYSEKDRTRLEKIQTYRRVGLGLAEIRALLSTGGGQTTAILTERIEQLNQEIARLRDQQRVIVDLLKNRTLLKRTRALDKHRWVEILAATGLDQAAMRRWHIEFETLAPEAHQDFLESLGITPEDITSIRDGSRSQR